MSLVRYGAKEVVLVACAWHFQRKRKSNEKRMSPDVRLGLINNLDAEKKGRSTADMLLERVFRPGVRKGPAAAPFSPREDGSSLRPLVPFNSGDSAEVPGFWCVARMRLCLTCHGRVNVPGTNGDCAVGLQIVRLQNKDQTKSTSHKTNLWTFLLSMSLWLC